MTALQECGLGEPQRKLWGLLRRRKCWTLSRRGKLLLLALVGTTAYGAIRGVHPFLTVSDGGAGDVMVVEGWIPTRPVAQAAKAFQRGRYRCAVVVRDVYDSDDKWASGRYSADYVAAELVQQGISKDLVHTLFCPVARKDRTYHCALAVRQWLDHKGFAVKSIDVVTLAAHSRRSRLLYGKAFGPQVQIGAIPLEAPTYDPDHWWRCSDGVRDVLGEAIAYLYARFLFWPPAVQPAEPDDLR